MKNTTTAMSVLSLAALAALSLTGCGDNENSGEAGTPDDESLLKEVLLSEAPKGAVSIPEARQDPTPGRKVTISGEVMGALNPLIDGRAILVLGDPTKLTSCNRIPGDACETPWDVCCDDPDVIKTSIATVQVVDDEGQPLKEGLRGLAGLTELSFLTVTGTVAEGSNTDNFLVNATGIHVVKESPFHNVPPVNPAHDHSGEEDDHDGDDQGGDDHEEKEKS